MKSIDFGIWYLSFAVACPVSGSCSSLASQDPPGRTLSPSLPTLNSPSYLFAQTSFCLLPLRPRAQAPAWARTARRLLPAAARSPLFPFHTLGSHCALQGTAGDSGSTMGSTNNHQLRPIFLPFHLFVFYSLLFALCPLLFDKRSLAVSRAHYRPRPVHEKIPAKSLCH